MVILSYSPAAVHRMKRVKNMMRFLKDNFLLVLFLVLVSLLFILWARMIVAQLKVNIDAYTWAVMANGFK